MTCFSPFSSFIPSRQSSFPFFLCSLVWTGILFLCRVYISFRIVSIFPSSVATFRHIPHTSGRYRRTIRHRQIRRHQPSLRSPFWNKITCSSTRTRRLDDFHVSVISLSFSLALFIDSWCRSPNPKKAKTLSILLRVPFFLSLPLYAISNSDFDHSPPHSTPRINIASLVKLVLIERFLVKYQVLFAAVLAFVLISIQPNNTKTPASQASTPASPIYFKSFPSPSHSL